jgi:DNA-binding MarR family transcriptional regulator
VSSIAIGTGLPLTTALRYIESLLNAGLVERRRDTGDGRRVLVLLTEKARWLFSQYQALLDESL